jgi:hypothetical protein
MFRGRFAGFADSADYGLRQVVGALLFCAFDLAEAEFGLALWSFVEADGHLATQIIFDEGGFVAGALGIPGVDADYGEIAGLAFGAASSGDDILRLISAGVCDAVQLEPGDGAHVGGRHAFAHGVRQIQLDEAGHDPAGYGDGLIAGLGGRVGFGGADGDFARGARG